MNRIYNTQYRIHCAAELVRIVHNSLSTSTHPSENDIDGLFAVYLLLNELAEMSGFERAINEIAESVEEARRETPAVFIAFVAAVAVVFGREAEQAEVAAKLSQYSKAEREDAVELVNLVYTAKFPDMGAAVAEFIENISVLAGK